MIVSLKFPTPTTLLLGVTAGLLAASTPVTPAADWRMSHPHELGHAPVKKDTHSHAEWSAPALKRSLATMRNLHTHELLVLGDFSPTQAQFSRFLRDRVTGQRIDMAPRLIELLRTLASQPGQDSPIAIEFVSGYRSWKLNELLRKKGHHVASHSQHTLGHAMDFRIGGLTSEQLAERIEALHWRGGLAYYPRKTDRFVHADVGPNRRWKGR